MTAQADDYPQAPDDLPGHVGFYITFNYGDVWECENDCPACAAEDSGSRPLAEYGADGYMPCGCKNGACEHIWRQQAANGRPS